MEKPKSYCEAVEHYDPSNVHRIYHDSKYGFLIGEDDQLFELLILEIFQAGLSWTTILNKRQNFYAAFHKFNISTVAAYQEADRQRLLNDAGIIRNRLKIDAAIHNANVILQLKQEFGSFKNWLDHHHPKSKQDWVKLFKLTFHFTGGEIVNEFLMSCGYLPGAHIEDCPVYKDAAKSNPPWLMKPLADHNL
ncbi:MAG: DNA-3-methyladenine glycosylase I [Prolixibacteraceae bacterium]